MYIIDRYPKIKINLKPGIYVFDNVSGSGKTYLCDKLVEYSGYGDNVRGVSYSDIIRNSYSDIMDEKEYDVIMFDRYDMYNEIITPDKLKHFKNSIVLVDSKQLIDDIDDNIVYCNMKADSIEVEQ